MSVQKSIQSLMVSELVITSLIGFSSSAALSQESINTPTPQNTTNTIQEATRPNWCPLYRRCG